MKREIYHSNQYDLNPPAPEPGMSVEEANFCLGLVTNLYNGTETSADRIRHLTQVLIKTPELFWTEFFYVTQPDKELTDRCRAFAASGAYDPAKFREQMHKLAGVIL